MALDQSTKFVLGALAEGRQSYAHVLDQYRAATGLGREQAARAFDHLVRSLIAEKLVDYEADPAQPAAIATLWLRPRGQAVLQAAGF